MRFDRLFKTCTHARVHTHTHAHARTHTQFLTHSQLAQQICVFWSLLQHSPEAGGFHALQLDSPVDVDLLTEAHIHQTGDVLALLARVQSCNVTEPQRSRDCTDARSCACM